MKLICFFSVFVFEANLFIGCVIIMLYCNYMVYPANVPCDFILCNNPGILIFYDYIVFYITFYFQSIIQNYYITVFSEMIY